MGSVLWLVPEGSRYLKIRATYDRTKIDDVAGGQFVKSAIDRLAQGICVSQAAKAEQGESGRNSR
jgi:hypothetical protein